MEQYVLVEMVSTVKLRYVFNLLHKLAKSVATELTVYEMLPFYAAFFKYRKVSLFTTVEDLHSSILLKVVE